MKLSVLSTLHGGFFFPDMLPGDTFRERLRSLKRLGFDAVEIWGHGLKAEIEPVRRALKEEGVKVSAICSGFRGSLLAADPAERLTCYRDFEELLELSATLEAGGLVFVPIFSQGPKVAGLEPMWDAAEVERRLFLDLIGKLTARAGTLGTTLLFNTLEEAADVCREVGSGALRILADFFHMNLEEADIAGSIRRHGRFIGHVHLVDSNRFLPGQGHTDFAPGIRALRESGYTGYLSLECFAKGDPETALSQAVTFMKELIQ